MKQIFSGEVFEAIPGSSGMVFSYRRGNTEDGDVILGFKMLNFESGAVDDVAKNVYLLAKFGTNYSAVLRHCTNYVTAKALMLSEGKVFLLNLDGSAYLIDGDGEPLWSGQLKYKGRVPGTLAIHNNSLWGTFYDLDALVRFNLSTLRDEIRIGKKGGMLQNPKGLFIEDNTAYVCSYTGNKTVKIDLSLFTAETLYTFNMPISSYIRAKNREYALLKSGLYEL